MKAKPLHLLLVTGFVACALVGARAQQKTPVPIPNPGVPQIMTLEDKYVRVSYNNEGYVTLGFRLAAGLVGQEWIMLETGMTVREGKPAQKLERTAISISTPDGGTVPLATQQEYTVTDLRGIEMQSKVIHDSINYFPPSVRDGCRLGYFAEMSSGTTAYDVVELSPIRGCVGRLYFKIPGGLKYGQHFLNVKFANSTVRVPFKIYTKEEEKFVDKNWKDIKKQVEESFKKKGGI
jgi:hypothetical protein